MGLDLSYIAGEHRFEIRLSQVDWQILDIIGKTCADAMELVAGVEDFGQPRSERRLDLLKAVETLLEKLEGDPDNLPYIYGFTITEGISKGCGGTGMTSGIRIGGDEFWYSLEGGLGRCILVKYFLGSDGKVHIAEQRDMRGLKSLKTDNMGEIKIYRKKKATRLKQFLIQLKGFLEKQNVENVTKILG